MKVSKSPLLWILLIILGVYFAAAALVIYVFGVSEQAGHFGDLFGGINGFFAAIGAIVALYTLRMQQKEIESRTESLQQGQRELQQQTLTLAEQVAGLLHPSHRSEYFEPPLEVASVLLRSLEEGVRQDLYRIGDDVLSEQARNLLDAEQKAAESHFESWSDLNALLLSLPGSTSSLYQSMSLETEWKEERAKKLSRLRKQIREHYTP